MSEDIRSLLGKRIRELRLKKEWSQQDLAQAAKLDRAYVSGIERGQRNISLKKIADIAAALGAPVHNLFIRDDTTAGSSADALSQIPFSSRALIMGFVKMDNSERAGLLNLLQELEKHLAE